MPLTDVVVRNAKPDPSRIQYLKDDRGLYLEISPHGGKWWRLRYWFKGRENRLSLGVYPDVGLKDARARRDELRSFIARGLDPSKLRKREKAQTLEDSLTFEAVARDWYKSKFPSWAAATAAHTLGRLEKDLLPAIGGLPIRRITAPDILAVIKVIEERGAEETAHRALRDCGAVFRFAMAEGLVNADPTPALHGVLTSVPVTHRPGLTDPRAVGALLRAVWSYEGSPVTAAALKLAAYSFVRPGELRHAEWAEFDLESAEWRIPAAKMKMRELHIVPLARQALAALHELHLLTGGGRFLFPSERTSERPMSECTVNAALRRMGYAKDEMTGHGFRSMASTLLNEQGWPPDTIERQLAHAERNGVRAAYNHADYLPERREMMQWWADYLDALRQGGKTPPRPDRG